MPIQFPSIILPTVAPLGTETETILDALEHTSLEFEVAYLQEKCIQIVAIEAGFGAPGPLNAWVELSPVLSTTSTWYWAAIGGGGGFIAPTAPTVIVGTGVPATIIHAFMLPWTIHSVYARLVVQTPVPAVAAGWLVQAIMVGK